MNAYERANQQESGMLDGAYRIYNEIKEIKDLGHVGDTLRRAKGQRLLLLNEMRSLARSSDVSNQIYKWIYQIEQWFSWK